MRSGRRQLLGDSAAAQPRVRQAFLASQATHLNSQLTRKWATGG